MCQLTHRSQQKNLVLGLLSVSDSKNTTDIVENGASAIGGYPGQPMCAIGSLTGGGYRPDREGSRPQIKTSDTNLGALCVAKLRHTSAVGCLDRGD